MPTKRCSLRFLLKKRNRLLQRVFCALLSVSLLLPYAPVYAAGEEAAAAEEAFSEEASAAEEADDPEADAVSWTEPAADWYTSYEYETKDGTL